MIKVKSANSNSDFIVIESLANIIWRAHYTTIIGKPQVDYMLKKFQSVAAIAEQVKNGYEYFILEYNKKPVGYISIKKETDALFLSKFYVLSDYRGKNIGKEALLFVEEQARTNPLPQIKLTRIILIR
jgi:diamine N-acetyltransferase